MSLALYPTIQLLPIMVYQNEPIRLYCSLLSIATLNIYPVLMMVQSVSE